MSETQLTLFDILEQKKGTDKYVRQITYEETKPFLLEIHYARRMPSINYAFGLFVDGRMIGVVTYGVPASNTLCKGIAGMENFYNVLELNRLVILPEYNGQNYVEAEVDYRRALEKNPDSPVLFMKMATLCDESLNDPLAAAWYYSEFLRVAPKSPERETAEICRRAALDRLLRTDENVRRYVAADGKLRAQVRYLAEENRRLKRALSDAKKRPGPKAAAPGEPRGERRSQPPKRGGAQTRR